jgi:dTDP-glucose pyrophosphorylase/CBS domain-containing protein
MLDAAVRRLPSVLTSPEASIKDAMAQLDLAGTGALVLAGDNGLLQGLVTDGDIRRAILAQIPLERACRTIATTRPVTASPSTTPAEGLRLMDSTRGSFVNSLPVVRADGVVVGLLLRKDIVSDKQLPLTAVIMAGGYGTRLLPLTERVPKPMLPVGDRPILERTVEQLRTAGIRRVAITTHHLAAQIADHFGDGQAYGVEVDYVAEDEPLGTAGALRLVKECDTPLLVINGDIVTTVRYDLMLDYHRRHGAELTVAVRSCELVLPYGVVETRGARVTGLREKPRSQFLINAGIYLVEPSARGLIPAGRRFDMTDLIGRLLEAGRPVVCFPIIEYWLDIGTPADYEQSHKDLSRAGV